MAHLKEIGLNLFYEDFIQLISFNKLLEIRLQLKNLEIDIHFQEEDHSYLNQKILTLLRDYYGSLKIDVNIVV